MNMTTKEYRRIVGAAPKRRAARGSGAKSLRKAKALEARRRIGHTIESVAVFVLGVTVSEANRRDHWAVKAARVLTQRSLVRYAFAGKKIPPLPVTVTLTRCAPLLLDKHDNLRVALKATADEIADLYAINDRRDDLMEFEYGQEKAKECGVRVEIRRMLATTHQPDERKSDEQQD